MTLFLLVAMTGQSKGKGEFTVLQWNVWQEGTMVPGGYDAIVNEIVRLQPDFVTFSEVRNYHNTRFNERIVASLKEKGLDYYSFYTYDTGLLSKHPITDSLTVFPENGDHGSIYRLTSSVNGHKVAVYTSHLDYLDCAYYNVRGYADATGKTEGFIYMYNSPEKSGKGWLDKYYLYQIPTNQIALNPELKPNNPGWE